MREADLRWSVVIELSGDELAETLLALQSRREREARDAYYRLRSLEPSGDAKKLYKQLRGMGSELIRVKMPKHSYDGIKLALAGIKRPGVSWGGLATDVSLESRKAILKKISESRELSNPALTSSREPERGDQLDPEELALLESRL